LSEKLFSVISGELPQVWKESIVVLNTKIVIKLTVVIIEECHCYQQCTKFLIFLSHS